MKKILRLSFFCIILIFLGFGSCTKEEIGQEAPQKKEIGKLSFGSFLNDMISENSLNKGSQSIFYDIPQCSDEAPLYVYVAIKVLNKNDEWEWYKNSNEEKIKIEVNPNGSDLNEDGITDAWFTQESADLELEEGRYSLEYFSVTDKNEEIIFMAPRRPLEGVISENIQYYNFVDKPLPIEISIRPGVKYYQPVEVLCFEEHYAFAFGYLFFDVYSTELIYLCTFGNVCSDRQQHKPAQFRMNVWKGDSPEEKLLVAGQNERRSFSDENGTHYYADALCFPLPKSEGKEEYYAKIWLVEDDQEILIREGSFSATDLAEIYREEQEYYYYHFREACCGELDNYNLLNDITDNEGECEEKPQEPEEPQDCITCDNNQGGKIKQLRVAYLGDATINLLVSHNGPGSSYEIFVGEVSPNEELLLLGEATNGGNPVPSVWTEMQFVISSTTYNLHTSCSQPLYPGLVFGNGLFEIVSAVNVNGQEICEPTEQ